MSFRLTSGSSGGRWASCRLGGRPRLDDALDTILSRASLVEGGNTPTDGPSQQRSSIQGARKACREPCVHLGRHASRHRPVALHALRVGRFVHRSPAHKPDSLYTQWRAESHRHGLWGQRRLRGHRQHRASARLRPCMATLWATSSSLTLGLNSLGRLKPRQTSP